MTAEHVVERLHAQVSGSGERTIVFVHGFGCDRSIWRLVAPAFEASHRVVVFDQAGCGRAIPAWDASRHASLQGYAQDLLDLLAALDLPPVVCVGHSVGSVVMALAAHQQPERFEHLVHLAPSPRFLNDPPDYVGGFEREDLDGMFRLMESNHFGWAALLAPMAMGETNPVELVREFEGTLCTLEPRIARQFARITFLVDVRAQMQQLQVPSTLVQCMRDSIAPVAVGRWLQQHVPMSTLQELDIAGHCPHVSHPEMTIGLLEGVLRDGARR